VTIYKGYGGMTGAEQDIVYCVVTRLEIGEVKTIVRSIDPHAFVVSHALADAEGGVGKRGDALSERVPVFAYNRRSIRRSGTSHISATAT
jgi:hypothetical protein